MPTLSTTGIPSTPTSLLHLGTNFARKETLEENTFQAFDLAVTVTLFGSVPRIESVRLPVTNAHSV